jgi:hypothetical protein
VSVPVLLVPDGPLEHDETSGGRPFHLKINKLGRGECANPEDGKALLL